MTAKRASARVRKRSGSTTGVTGDVAFVLPVSDDPRTLHLLRRRSPTAAIELGTIRPLEEGKPIDGEVLSLRPRGDIPLLFDVQVELAAPAPPASAGPPQVATPSYRRGWDAIWGKGARNSHLN